MTVYYEDGQVTLHQGHVLDVLPTLEAESVHCCVTSPPYWGLRSYKGDQMMDWGGDADCEHEWGWQQNRINDQAPSTASTLVGSGRHRPGTKYDKDPNGISVSGVCSKCGAWHGALGHEPMPDMYVAHLVEVFRAVRRVMHDTGVLWVNLDDSRAGSGGPGGDFRDGKGGDIYGRQYNRQGNGLKPLDLCGIPERFALAMQSDGWYYRARIVWHKPNCMPESVNGWRWERCRVNTSSRKRRNRVAGAEAGVTGMRNHSGNNYEAEVEWADCPGCPKCSANGGYVLRRGSWRPTEDWEYVFMFAKTNRYFCDADAVREPSHDYVNKREINPDGSEQIRKSWRDHKNRDVKIDSASWGSKYGSLVPQGGRNLRSVWRINPEPSSLSHFAAFPSALPERCILASTSERGHCPRCGTPWARCIEKGEQQEHPQREGRKVRNKSDYDGDGYAVRDSTLGLVTETRTLGWRACCDCGEKPVPSVVCDPFSGTGTTLRVARALGRHAIGVELSEDYCRMSVDQTGLRQMALGG